MIAATGGEIRVTVLVAGLLLALVVVVSRSLARRSGIPYPVFLVVAGAGVSFLPGLPTVHLEPNVVFYGFIPPLVYYAGIGTSPRELRANARPIGLSALGLVLVTTFAVAGAALGVAPRLGWSAAFILGAVVAPTDPVAATSTLNRLGGPPRVTIILEGESLVNDGVALTLFGLGLASLTAPTSPVGGFLDFLKVAGGGVVFGLVVGLVTARLRRLVHDASAEIVVSLVVPFIAYLPADELGLSGILATLVAGLVSGQHGIVGIGPSGRISINEFWRVLVFLLESVLFVLVGLQLRALVGDLGRFSGGDLAAVIGVTVAAVVVIRLAWWLAVPNLRWRPEGRVIDTGETPLTERLALGWGGLRGALSLAAALSVPVAVHGRTFVPRSLVVFATFCVILVTLVGQGTTMPWLLARLHLVGSEQERAERQLARRRCTEAALRELDRLSAEEELDEQVTRALRQLYEQRLSQLEEEADGGGAPGDAGEYQRLEEVQHQLVVAQHRMLDELHRKGQISYAVMRRVRRDLDFEQATLET